MRLSAQCGFKREIAALGDCSLQQPAPLRPRRAVDLRLRQPGLRAALATAMRTAAASGLKNSMPDWRKGRTTDAAFAGAVAAGKHVNTARCAFAPGS